MASRPSNPIVDALMGRRRGWWDGHDRAQNTPLTQAIIRATRPAPPARGRMQPHTTTDAHGDTYVAYEDGSKAFLYNNANDLQGAKQLLAQPIAGLISSTVANSAESSDDVAAQLRAQGVPESTVRAALAARSAVPLGGGYTPAIVNSLPATFGVVSELVNPGSVAPDSFVARQMQAAGRAIDRTNSVLGIRNPQNPLELSANVLGSLLVPGKIPGSVNAATRAGRVGQRVVRGAAELALPLRQTSMAAALGIAVPANTAIMELIESNPQLDNPEYNSFGDSSRARARNEPQPAPHDEDEFLQTLQQAGNSTGDLFLDAITAPDPVAATFDDHVETAQEDHTARNAGIALAMVFGGGAAYRMGRAALRRNAATLVGDAGRELMGTEYRNSRPAENVRIPFTNTRTNNAIITRPATVARRVVGAAFRQDRPIRSAILDHVGPMAARQAGYKLDLLSNTALGSKYRNFIQTGEMENGFRAQARLGPTLRAFGEELAPPEQAMVENAMLAHRALDDLNHNGVQTAFPDTTPTQLRSIVSAVTGNAKLAKYLNEFQQSGRDLLAYRVHGGALSQKQASELLHQRPHYTPFNRAVVYDSDIEQYNAAPFTANRSGPLQGATSVEGASVREGATGSPVQGLLQQWADSVRFVEQNSIRAQVLQQLDGMGINPQTGKPWVQRLPARASLHDGENIHTVFENGEKVHYRVTDPALNQSLHFSPRQTIREFDAARQMMQNMQTGPIGSLFNLFGAVKSPLYDSLTSSALQGNGARTGVLNELMLKLTGGRVHIGPLDPTSLVSGFTGAPRVLWGQMLEGMSNRLSSELLKDHSYLVDMMRKVGVDPNALDQTLQGAVRASIKSNLDQLGISSQTMHGTPDPRQMLTQMHEIAPQLSTDVARRIYDEAKKGNIGFLRTRLAQGSNAYARLRAGPISRMYGNILQAFQNGAKAQALATTRAMRGNRGKTGAGVWDREASAIRRMSIDTSQHGGSNTINRLLSSLQYAYTGMQSLYELGSAVKTRPVIFSANVAAATAGLVALNYIARLTDPEAAAQHDAKTPEQRAATVTLPGGAEYPVDPLYRLMIYPTMAITDQISGIESGELNVDFAEAMDRMLGDGNDAQEWRAELMQGMAKSAQGANPIDPLSFAFGSPLLAYLGVDVSRTRMERQAVPQEGQQLSGLDQDSNQTDALLNNYNQNMLFSVTGAVGRGLYGMVNDFYRSALHDNSVEHALNRAAESWREGVDRSAPMIRPLLPGYEHLDNVVDRNWSAYNARKDGIERAQNVYNRDVRAHGITSMSYPMQQLPDVPLPEFNGTQAATVGFYATMLDRETANMRTRLRQLSDQAASIRNRSITPRQQNNRELNTINTQRREIAIGLLMHVRHYEDVIGRAIGDEHFTFRDYNPRDYMRPIPQAPIPQPQQ